MEERIIQVVVTSTIPDCKHHNGWFKRLVFKKWLFTFERVYYFCMDCHEVILKNNLDKPQ